MGLKRIIAEALNETEMPVEELISKLEVLEGEYFTGSLKGGKTEVDDSNLPEHLWADYLANFENIKEDGFSLDDILNYSHFIKDTKEFEKAGVSFADYVHKDMDDGDIADMYSDENGKYWLFVTVMIEPNKFDGDIEKLREEIDGYFKVFKDKYDEIKAGVSKEQKKQVKNLTKKTAAIKEAIRVNFKNGVVTEHEQTHHHYHATFSSNSTSHGLYVVEYPAIVTGFKNLTKKDIENYMYLIESNIVVPKPKGSIYSSVTGATKDFVIDKFKQGDYEIDGNVIRLRDLPYTDLFIGD